MGGGEGEEKLKGLRAASLAGLRRHGLANTVYGPPPGTLASLQVKDWSQRLMVQLRFCGGRCGTRVQVQMRLTTAVCWQGHAELRIR